MCHPMRVYDVRTAIANHYLDFDIVWSSEKETIRRYFQREVLVFIEKGVRECGFDTVGPCPNCYAYEHICEYHEEVKECSYQELKNSIESWIHVVFKDMDYMDFQRFTPADFEKAMANWKQRMDVFKWAGLGAESEE